jgi:tRNA nucleotidyltransferase (CCA-adding enzyme)
MDPILTICDAVAGAGGRALVVGGWVRDRLLGLASKDVDVEVYGLEPERLKALLRGLGRVNTVGESFTVYKVLVRGAGSRDEIDVSIPRRESKTGRGHRGFTVEGDPAMTVEEAARRRDFTINAIMFDPLTGEHIDPCGGGRDLEARRLRVVDPATFADDSLRVLRAAQFAARFRLTIDPATAALCRGIDLSDLPAERVWGEMEKLLLRAEEPSIGLEALRELGVLPKLFPELEALIDCEQEPEYHPEGDVWTHTKLVVDEARAVIGPLPRHERITVMLAALCHDLGKPATTAHVGGRIRSLGHDRAGLAPTGRLLDGLNVHTAGGYDVRKQVLALVETHLVPGQFYHERARVRDGAFRRLARRVDCRLLYLVARSDSLGRTGAARQSAAQEWFIGRVRDLGLEGGAPPPVLLGRHVLELGVAPGPEVGRVTREVYELQLDGAVTDLDSAIAAARELLRTADAGRRKPDGD